MADPDLYPLCCDSNCDTYVSKYGGSKVEGVYVLKHERLEIFHLVRHFVVFDGSDLIDITPFDDDRLTNYFIETPIKRYNTFVRSLAHLNIWHEQEPEILYYVYCYVDPTTNLPFYVGKGTQKRAYTHMSLAKCEGRTRNSTRFYDKLRSMKSSGIEPLIIFLAQNIEDESIAYEIEEDFILHFGRKGYEANGILLNSCDGARPPNHKGKTYDQIYGNRAEEQRQKRHQLQLQAGGWFKGRKHSDQAMKRFKEMSSGENNPLCNYSEDDILQLGKAFCAEFDQEISQKRWFWWAEKNGLPPNILRSFRFGRRHLLDVFSSEWDARIVKESMLWFHHPITGATCRCADWEFERGVFSPPEGFIRGRGTAHKRG